VVEKLMPLHRYYKKIQFFFTYHHFFKKALFCTFLEKKLRQSTLFRKRVATEKLKKTDSRMWRRTNYT
jgi:hypothetical protein